MATMSARQIARAFENQNFASPDLHLTRSPDASEFHLRKACERVLSMRNEKALLQVHHTSISCILDKYFRFWENLKFHDFLEKSTFFAVFAQNRSKYTKSNQTVTFFC